MPSETFETDSIGPQLDLADAAIPSRVGERLATLYDREEPFETWADWVSTVRAVSARTRGEPPTPDDLCRVDDGDHRVEVDGESESFVCVLDPLVVPFLRETPATVRSVTPEDRESVAIDVEADGISVDATDAVVSFGVSSDPDVGGSPVIEDVYAESCPYIHVFASADEYERWTDRVDAETTSVPVETGVAIARELAGSLFGA